MSALRIAKLLDRLPWLWAWRLADRFDPYDGLRHPYTPVEKRWPPCRLP